MSDEIIEELWRIKDGVPFDHNHDVRQLADYLQGQMRVARDRTADRRSANEMAGTDKTVESAIAGRRETPCRKSQCADHDGPSEALTATDLTRARFSKTVRPLPGRKPIWPSIANR